MGLDIHIITDKSEELFFADPEFQHIDRKNSLSRTFCNFICRKHVVEHEPELDQIGRITGIDITPLYEMENYPDEGFIQSRLEYEAKTEQERQQILVEAEADKEKLNGNIDKVMQTLNNLLEKLNEIENLPNLLIPTDFESLDNKGYFSDFKTGISRGYNNANFGEDLRNFARFLEYSISKGAKTVWFHYG